MSVLRKDSKIIYIFCLLRPDSVEEPGWDKIKANCSGIQLEKIDESYFKHPYLRPLPHAIIHCLANLHPQLREFDSKHPGIIVDHPNDINRLFERDTMLKCVENLMKSQVGIPKQKFVMNGFDFNDFVTNQGGDLQFPMIIKTMEAGGSKASHTMHLALTVGHLVELEKTRTISFPFVVQEFNDHGGRFIKVYVLGSGTWCVEIPSIEDSGQWLVENNRVVINRRQSSNEFKIIETSELVKQIVVGLKKELKLKTFNFDMIKVVGANGQHKFLIVDINYFPRYSKFANHEALMTAYFHEIARERKPLSHSYETSCTLINTRRNTEVLGTEKMLTGTTC